MKIFIASSSELEHKRLVTSEISLFINRMLLDMGYEDRVEPEKWEYLDSAMGVEHKQEEYNRALSSCDAELRAHFLAFVLLLGDKAQSRRSSFGRWCRIPPMRSPIENS